MNSASSSASSPFEAGTEDSVTGLCFAFLFPVPVDASEGAARTMIGSDMHSRRIAKLAAVVGLILDMVLCCGVSSRMVMGGWVPTSWGSGGFKALVRPRGACVPIRGSVIITMSRLTSTPRL